jgi:guanyl-specific ribonuclease Sa
MSSFRLSRIDEGPARERHLALLLLADESEQQVRSYMQRGDLYEYAADGEVAGIVLAIPRDEGTLEVKAVAIAPAHARGVRRVVVGTGNAGIGQLAYYQKAGFRLTHIERDFFSPARGYPEVMQENGIRLRDMVWMEQVL